MSMVTASAEEVDVSIFKYMIEDVGGDLDKLENDATKEVMEEALAHMKMGLAYHMSPVTLKIQNGLKF